MNHNRYFYGFECLDCSKPYRKREIRAPKLLFEIVNNMNLHKKSLALHGYCLSRQDGRDAFSNQHVTR